MYITFCIITMFIGFLLSQWQRSHLPTAGALQWSSHISCETPGTAQSCRWLRPSTSSSLREAIQETFSQTILDCLSSFFWFSCSWKIPFKCLPSCILISTSCFDGVNIFLFFQTPYRYKTAVNEKTTLDFFFWCILSSQFVAAFQLFQPLPQQQRCGDNSILPHIPASLSLGDTLNKRHTKLITNNTWKFCSRCVS